MRPMIRFAVMLTAALTFTPTLAGAQPAGSGAAGDQAGTLSLVVEHPRRIVTDTPPGGYQAFPDICRLPDGELLIVYYAGYGHVSLPNDKMPRGGYIAAVHSRDEGQTWSKPEVVVDTPLDDRDPSICVLPDGVLLLNFFTYRPGGDCDTCLIRSTDGGKTWSEPRVILSGYATSTPIRRLRSGRLLLPVYREQAAAKRSLAAVCISDDQGQTWRAPAAAGLDAPYEMNEADMFERADGSLLMIMRSVMTATESTDHGETWGPVRELGFSGHCPYLFRTPEGVLLLATRVPFTELRYSLDEGRQWRGPLQVEDVRGAYPSMIGLKDGSTLIVYYEEPGEKPGGVSSLHAAEIRIKK